MTQSTSQAPDATESTREQDQMKRNQAVIALLNSWEQEDVDEQRETLEFLMRALDEDRLSSRKHFA